MTRSTDTRELSHRAEETAGPRAAGQHAPGRSQGRVRRMPLPPPSPPLRAGTRSIPRGVAFLRRLDHVDAVEVLHGLAEAGAHRLLGRAERHARVVELLVGLRGALRVANLSLQVVAVLGLVLADAVPERPLRVGVDVHLDRARLDRVPDVLARRARAAVEDEEDRLLTNAVLLLRDVRLRVVQDLRRQLDVARRVHAVHVTEGSGDGELTVGHGRERLV